jgi:outer membrane biosynthesis protein TonB
MEMPKPELEMVLQEFRTAAHTLLNACDCLQAYLDQDESPTVADAPPDESPITPPEAAAPTKEQTKTVPPKEQPKPPKTKELTLEKVRSVLADKSRNGYTSEIRDLLEKYGGSKLSEISPDRYPELMEDAEGLE